MDDGTPTALYDQLKDATSTSTILGVQMKSLYAELYAIKQFFASKTPFAVLSLSVCLNAMD